MVCRPGMSVRDTSQPIGAATRQQITAEVVAMIAVVSSGSRNAGSVNSVTKFCSVGCRALSVNANTASHDIGSTISTIMKAANSHRTGLVQSMRDFRGSVAVMVMVMLIHESDVSLILRSRFSGVSKDECRDATGPHGSAPAMRIVRNDGVECHHEEILKP